jgi:ceramide glucosyltransferase
LVTNGKVSTLIQLLPHAQCNFVLINDSDITVSPHYLQRVMALHAPASMSTGGRKTGLVTALYRGRAHGTLPSRLEALGIATDFQPSVLLARWIEGGLRYGLGSTLAVSREALENIGGLAPLVDHLADDYELGERIFKAGYAVALSAEVVETSVPAYTWKGFFDHQLRWYRTVRDARPWGYAGLVFTYGLGWALLNLVAGGLSPLSLWLLALSFFLRLSLAMTVGAEVLGDRQVLPSLWLIPLRDVVAMGLWVAGFAGNTIVWRGERFAVKHGKLENAPR